jgi:Zn-finger protein
MRESLVKHTILYSHKYFENRSCKMFPCHKDLWGIEKEHNCLFCYCPLYHKDCIGNYSITDKGIKDCSDCNLVHSFEGWEIIQQELGICKFDKK